MTHLERFPAAPGRLQTEQELVLREQAAPEPTPTLEGIPGRLTATSWEPPEDLLFERWLSIGETFQQMERSVMWWIGDWWRFGSKKYGGDRRYGDMTSQAAKDHVKDVTGHAYKTVTQAAWVAEKVEFSRRRENLPFAYHQNVAVLEAPEAEKLLDEVERTGMKHLELRERVKARQKELEQERLAHLPVPELVIPACHVVVGDARALAIEDETVDLIVTSPPYALDKAYGGAGDILVDEWRAFMSSVCRELYRVAKDGARLVLNIPLDTTRPYPRPTYAQTLFAAWRAGWSYRCTGVWSDAQLGKSTARGSVDSSSSPSLIAPVEMLLVMYKGESWGRGVPEGCPSDLAHQDWLDWTNFAWAFPGESNPWEGHPAAFPLELPRRVIHLLSFPNDLVLDPFVGSGTTALAALRAGRRFFGCDREEWYVRSTLRRVEKGISP